MYLEFLISDKQYDEDVFWWSVIKWTVRQDYRGAIFTSCIDNSKCKRENIERYVEMIDAIENNTEAFITIDGINPMGEPYGALLKAADGNFTIDYGNGGMKVSIGKLLNDKSIFEGIVYKFLYQ